MPSSHTYMTTPTNSPQSHPLIDRAQVGARLRANRKRQRLTLKQLSERSGVALSTLSKMELGQISVSYEKLAAAARALRIDMSILFTPDAPTDTAAQPTVVGTSLIEAPGYGTGGYEYHLLAGEFPGRNMTPLYAKIMARDFSEFDDYVRHPGQEFTFVLSGRVRIHFENGEQISLKERETAYFNSEIGHIYLTEGDDDAEVIAVMSEQHQPEAG